MSSSGFISSVLFIPKQTLAATFLHCVPDLWYSQSIDSYLVIVGENGFIIGADTSHK